MIQENPEKSFLSAIEGGLDRRANVLFPCLASITFLRGVNACRYFASIAIGSCKDYEGQRVIEWDYQVDAFPNALRARSNVACQNICSNGIDREKRANADRYRY